ncbi:uncharacterized protein LOC128676084 [Plodia interpunctella]|uniref:uncharacterized protein LOC128676084 n=1 Tax=Plodia interpunctella TaxID=58824 RepID=UPI00236829AA|nr:uncharacterized protein LOC128676084 [Plodia interpunctella]
MKLSLVFELLLIFILLAFAAQAKSTRKQKNNHKKGIQNRNDAEKPEDNTINKYCKCQESFCNCCRDFDLPVVNLNGPGCASLTYLSGDKMAVSLSFGRKVIANRTLSSKKPSPVCMPLPGGISKFCGRVYNIARAGEEFRACLGLELQSKSAVEAAVRVSCFKFGPRGVTSEQADPLPLVPQNEREDDDDDDDDDVDFDLGDDDDDDDDDDAANDVESADYTGFSLLSEDLLGGLFGTSGNKKPNKNRKKQAPAPTPSTTTTLSTTTRRPRPSRRPSRKPTKTTTPRTVATKPTTIRVRPSGNRRPIRKPSRKPSRKPTTNIVSESTFSSPLTVSSTEPISVETFPSTQSPVRNDVISTAQEPLTFESITFVTQKPAITLAASTAKTITNFEDPGLEMSLAHITGQLSVMPSASQVSPNTGKESDLIVEKDQMNYEKIETITKVPSTVPLVTPVPNSDEMIQIVTRLDSEEKDIDKDRSSADESRAHFINTAVPNDFYGGLSLKQKKKGRHNDYDLDDLDVLNFDQIGKTVGEELGIFGGKKHNKNNNRHNNKNKKVRDGKKDDDYSVIGLDSLESLIGINNNKQNKKNRRRQNKMMRGEWSQPQV